MENSELRKQDLALLLYIVSKPNQRITYRNMADGLGMSLSSISASIARCRASKLLDIQSLHVQVLSLEEFMVHGVGYVFPAEVGRVVRGVPTYVSAAPINEHIAAGTENYVWASPTGTIRGHKVQPLFTNAPESALRDEPFYRLLVIADTLRLGRVREREVAISVLHQYLVDYGENEH